MNQKRHKHLVRVKLQAVINSRNLTETIAILGWISNKPEAYLAYSSKAI